MILQIQQYMENNIFEISSYNPKFSDSFFFDNNVWIHILCPMGNTNQSKQKKYSNFLSAISSANGAIFVNSMVLSEFANTYLRYEFNLWKDSSGIQKPTFKKDFVGTPLYIKITKEIKSHINKIMQICEKSSDNFNAININNILSHFEFIDFNDSYYIEFMALSNWKFVTDDSDFKKYKNHSITVISDLKTI